MKKLYYLIIFLFLLPPLGAQVTTQNYIRTRTMRDANSQQYMDHIQYFDGLGRPYMQVQKGGAGATSHLASLQEYDECGRAWQDWLPGIIQSDYVAPATLKNQLQQYYLDSLAFSRRSYRTAPLDQLTSVAGPGQAWYGKAVKTDYLFNESSSASMLACKKYTTLDSGGSGVTTAGYYKASTLSVTRTTDEDGHISYSFSNRVGQVLLTRQMKEKVPHDTYSVYDSFGRLCYVLTPMYQESGDLYRHAYEYRYDGLGRCIEKKQPDCLSVKYEYDNADRVSESRSCVQQVHYSSTNYYYDAFGRTTESTFHPYPAPGEPMIPEPLEMNLYDNYDFLNQPEFGGIRSRLTYQELAGYGTRYVNATDPALSAVGKLTCTHTLIPKTNQKVYTVFYYDKHGNLIQQRTANHLDGYDVDYFAYSFAGSLLKHQHEQAAPGKSAQTEVYSYSYDHLERVTKVTHKLNAGAPVTLVENTYDALGRLSAKKRHGVGENATTYLDNTTYAYNIRNWPTKINGGKFTQTLQYTTGPGTPCYNGNVSSMTWQVGGESTPRGYKYTYDGLNRLTSGVYGEGSTLTANVGRFTESASSYDKNGNILSLQRWGKTGASTYHLVDNLTLAYKGNQLHKVSDAITAAPYGTGTNFIKGSPTTASEYSYDYYGNLTVDSNKKISNIQYNSLYLPTSVTFSTGNTISNAYGGNGVKYRTQHTSGGTTTTTDYCRNVIYDNGAFSKLLTGEGYVTLSGATPTYHYFLPDHQGNHRVVLHQNGTVEEVNHYYPFGGLFGEGTATVNQPYKYNGKELNRKYGLDWYDYGARQYDAALGRFTTVDPMSERLYAWSPYVYCLNSPIKMIDPTGKYGETVWDVFSLVTGVKSLADNIVEGNVGGAIVDGVGVLLDAAAVVLPVVPGGVGAAIKGVRAVDGVADVVGGEKAVNQVVKTVHGNSKMSTKAQHAYDVKEISSGKVVKTGVSGGKTRKSDGKSYRAEQQVRKWNKNEGEGKYESVITHKEPAGEGSRDKILDYEKKRALELKDINQLDKDKHSRP